MLRLPHATAADLLGEGIEQGQDLLERASLIGDQSDYESWKTTRKQWIERTAETLARIYEGPQQALDFKSEASSAAGGQQWQIEYKRDSNCVRSAIDILVSLQHRLERELAGDPEPEQDDLADEHHWEHEHEPGFAGDAEPAAVHGTLSEHDYQPIEARLEDEAPARGDAPEPAARMGADLEPAPGSSSGPRTDRTRQVFLVHGRNDEVKQAVAGLLERTGPHEVTILNERPSDRRMLVEQLVEDTAEFRYAVVLLTADDVGAPRLDSDREPYFSPRARQGVVFEMGVLVATLTPRCMCVLYEDGVELPCDLDGIVYVRLDLAGTWQSKLLLHLRDAGFDYDLNRLAPI